MQPKRKHMRLKNYDYSQPGYYFVTICTKGNRHVFWDVGTTCGRPLSAYGLIVQKEIGKIAMAYENAVTVDTYAIMPNHVHMIIIIHTQENGRPQVVPTLSRIVQQFKGSITKQIGVSIWQSRFNERVIRNESEYLEIWNYIDQNPLKWELDQYYTPL